MVSILLRGCSGRMGRMISDLAAQNENTVIAAGVDLTPAQAAYPVFTTLCECSVPADVLVDFTREDEIEDSIRYCTDHHTALLVGTTGLSEQQMDLLREAALTIPVFWASNLSMGVALLEQLCRNAAAFLQDGFDIEITETHHKGKLDAPSGTALTLAQAIRDQLQAPAPFVHGRQGRCPRNAGEIGIHALRGGTVTGEHQVHFFGHDETVTLSHSAQSRGVFAAGALNAALFLADKPAGFYSMKDLVLQSSAAARITLTPGTVQEGCVVQACVLQTTPAGCISFVPGSEDSPLCLIRWDKPDLNAQKAASVLCAIKALDITPALVQYHDGQLLLAVERYQTRMVLDLLA